MLLVNNVGYKVSSPTWKKTKLNLFIEKFYSIIIDLLIEIHEVALVGQANSCYENCVILKILLMEDLFGNDY